jgi:hypothetical protein
MTLLAQLRKNIALPPRPPSNTHYLDHPAPKCSQDLEM